MINNTDLREIQGFSLKITDDWANWEFEHKKYEDVPLAFFNRFNKNVGRYNDLSMVASRKEDGEFMTVQGNTKIVNKDYISKNIRMIERKKMAQTNIRIFTKKQKKNNRPWHMQYKTKFKEITAKSDWIVAKSFGKRDFTEELPPLKHFAVHPLLSCGALYSLNDRVQKISWNPVEIKPNEEYNVKPVYTLRNALLKAKAEQLLAEQDLKRVSVILSLEYLLAIVTSRGGQYPWNIYIEKEGSVIVFQKYKDPTQNKDISYLDLFTTYENTTNNMPGDESRVKHNCINATKLTQMFKDILASGELIREEKGLTIQEQEEEPEKTCIQKLIKIQMDDIDFYTTVRIDGAKVRDGQIEECLIRAFMQTGTDGSWIESIKTSQSLIFTEYLANSCSLQKWVCEGILAGVNLIKLGFIGITREKPMLLNVHETTISSLEGSISFKHQECWAIMKRVVDQILKYDNGEFILSRASYTPLSIKLFRLEEEID